MKVLAMLVPQQHRIVGTAPHIAPIVLGLNNSATYLGSTVAGVVGALAIPLVGAPRLGFVGAGCAVGSLVVAELASVAIDAAKKKQLAAPGVSSTVAGTAPHAARRAIKSAHNQQDQRSISPQHRSVEMNTTNTIANHYERESLVTALRALLIANGLGERPLTTTDLAQFDQFHSRGLEATVELAQALPITADTLVIDIGAGLGGPSRYLAETFGCRVLGIDLSQSFVDGANFLADRIGLTDKVTYRQGDALSLPFDSDMFDLAWNQHVAMNIADRPKLYSEAFRVLRRGGRLAVFDVVADSGEPLHFPVPWARVPTTSFLLTAAEMREVLTSQGFRIESWTDRTDAGIAWFEDRERERAQGAKPPLGIQAVLGPDFPAAVGNLRRNLSEGRAALLQLICEKP
jgi:SAM-dependent methyltransferase